MSFDFVVIEYVLTFIHYFCRLGGAGNFLGKSSVKVDEDPMLTVKALVSPRFLSVVSWNVAAINNNVRLFHMFMLSNKLLWYPLIHSLRKSPLNIG